MERLLGGLAIVAAVLMTIAIIMGAGPFADGGWSAASLKGSRITVDAVSFGLGFVAGLIAIWLARVPWAAIPRHILASILGWQRHAVFMTLAVVSASVLLFY